MSQGHVAVGYSLFVRTMSARIINKETFSSEEGALSHGDIISIWKASPEARLSHFALQRLSDGSAQPAACLRQYSASCLRWLADEGPNCAVPDGRQRYAGRLHDCRAGSR